MIIFIQKFKDGINQFKLIENKNIQKTLKQVEKTVLELRNQLQLSVEQKNNFIQQFFIERVQFNESIIQISKEIFRLNEIKEQFKKIDCKILMYYFQVLNLITIYQFQNQLTMKKCQKSQLLLQNVLFLIQGLVTHQRLFYNKTLKAFLIFMFNFLKNTIKNQLTFQFIKNYQFTLLTLLKQSMNYIFNRLDKLKKEEQLSKIDEQLDKNKENSNESNKQNIQWLSYLVQTIFQLYHQQQQKKGFIQVYFNYISMYHKAKFLYNQYQLLHIIGNFLQQVIEQRTTTQLILKHQSPLSSVRQLYKKQKQSDNLKISLNDYQFLFQVFQKYFILYKTILKRIIIRNKVQNKIQNKVQNKVENKEEQQFQMQNLEGIQQNLTQILRIFNCILFLGGYNNPIQQIARKRLISSESSPLAALLEISYIIYTEQQFLQKAKRKIQLVKVPESNLYNLLNINKETQFNFNQQQQIIIKQQISKKLIPGQLSSILRLLTNLIHINNNSQYFFEQNLKYVYIILSLTHQSQIQMTMKQWAILFIKNCCQNQKIRTEIDKVKINMKVDQPK